MRAGFALLILLLATAFAGAAETPIPAAPARWVTDDAGFMSVDAARSLDRKLEAFALATGRQFIVYIGKTTGGPPIEDWAVRAFEAWKVGRKGLDDGIALFIMADDHQVRIEVGYGLEPQVTDLAASRIIREIIVPRIQAGDHDGAVTAGAAAIAHLLSPEGIGQSDGTSRQPRGPGTQGRSFSIWQLIVFGIIGVLFLILLVTHPSLAIFLLMNVLSSGRRRGSDNSGGWGGGGFGGGGGRSGGGGASGSW
ncbi:MAG: hypothetical protein DMF61_00770 [Blastocatellia bacterium AA13]|nr:MAG: hypothetical protein DMF61_00770 [Blastocatellia bacterium AA13]